MTRKFIFLLQLNICKRQLSEPDLSSLAAAVGGLFSPPSLRAAESDSDLDPLDENDVSPSKREGEHDLGAVRAENPEGDLTIEVERERRKRHAMGSFGVSRSARRSESLDPETARLENFERVARKPLSRGDLGYRTGLVTAQPTSKKGTESASFDDSGTFRRGEGTTEEEPRKGAWRHAKQRRTLEASKVLEAQYSKSRREEMLTFLTHTERESLGAGYERIDPATLIPRDGADGDEGGL